MFDTRNTKAKTTYLSSFTGWPGWSGYGWYWHSWAWGPSFGPGPYDMDATSRPITRYQAYAEIVLLTDAQAKAEPRAINAHEIIQHLRPPPPPRRADTGGLRRWALLADWADAKPDAAAIGAVGSCATK